MYFPVPAFGRLPMKNWFKKIRESKMVLFASIFAVVFLIVGVWFISLRIFVDNGNLNEPDSTWQIANIVASSDQLYNIDDPKPDELPVEVLSSTSFLQYVSETKDNVSGAQINPVSGITGILSDSVEDSGEQKIYASRFLSEQYDELLNVFEQKNVDVTVSPGSPSRVSLSRDNPTTNAPVQGSSGSFSFTRLFSAFMITFVILVLFFIFFLKPMRNNLKDSNNSKNGVLPPDTRFSDVAGCDEAIEDLQELVLFLKDPERFTRTGAKPSKGALLVGPPGTGKTLLARAIAGEAGVPFYSASGSDFVEMFVGVGAKRIRDIFKKARKHPDGAIIFIDELDAVGRKRSGNQGGNNNQEHENTLNALLVEMDGFVKSKVVVIGATNREDVLDDALTRPGRLDKKIHVGLPDRLGRERIFEVHMKEKPLNSDIDISLLARRTPGMSGAEIAQIVNEACMEAARKDKPLVDFNDFDSALATVAMGKARLSAVVSQHDRIVTAWHEAGHTVSAMVLPEADDPVSVSIIPRGPAGGVTWMSQGDDLFLTRKRAFARLVVAMSGRAAEELLLDGEFTSGPHGDLTAATNTALAMVTQYGMSDLGLMIRSEGFLSTGGKITDETVDAVESLLAEALTVARETLASHKKLFNKIVEGLLEYDTLTAPQLEAIRNGESSTRSYAPPAPKEYRRKKDFLVEEVHSTNKPRTLNNHNNSGGKGISLKEKMVSAYSAARKAWRTPDKSEF
jgi:cell division protease FtsH